MAWQKRLQLFAASGRAGRRIGAQLGTVLVFAGVLFSIPTFLTSPVRPGLRVITVVMLAVRPRLRGERGRLLVAALVAAAGCAGALFELRNSQGRFGWLVDTRGEGGYVVAAGSVRRQGRYQVTRAAPIADLPAWLLHAWTATSPRATTRSH